MEALSALRLISAHITLNLNQLMAVVTTLNFLGRTEKALTLYREALGAETLFLMRFRDCPDKSFMQPGMEQMIFHATFRIDGTEFMASDVGYSNDTAAPFFAGFSLALNPESIERARAIFAALSDGGRVIIPLAESSFTGWYGIVVDSIGVSWKINVRKISG
jgi:PhnB protein